MGIDYVIELDCGPKRVLDMDELRPQLENNTVRCGAGEYTKGVGLNNARNVKGPPL
jgi:hypothetical protein